MLNSNDFLASCSKLGELGLELPVKIGSRVSRGFADLGYEEFYLLPANKLLSIYTAKTSDWLTEHHKFFFVVPDTDQLVQAFQAANLQVEISFQQSEWLVKLSDQSQEVKQSGVNLTDLLIKSYCKLKQ